MINLYVHVCMHAYVCLCIWLYVCGFVCVLCLCMFLGVRVWCARVLASIQVCVFECVWMRVNAYVHKCVCIWCVYVHLFICVWLCVLSYIDDNFDNALDEGVEDNIDDHGIPHG